MSRSRSPRGTDRDAARSSAEREAANLAKSCISGRANNLATGSLSLVSPSSTPVSKKREEIEEHQEQKQRIKEDTLLFLRLCAIGVELNIHH